MNIIDKYKIQEKHYHIQIMNFTIKSLKIRNGKRGRRSRDRMVVGFITTFAISAYHH